MWAIVVAYLEWVIHDREAYINLIQSDASVHNKSSRVNNALSGPCEKLLDKEVFVSVRWCTRLII